MTIQEIFDNLQNGYHYYDDFNDLHWTVLCLSVSGYIHYRHFGSSAIKNNIKELTWLLETIFEMTPDEFTAKYKIARYND